MDVVVKRVSTGALKPGSGSWLHCFYGRSAFEKALNLSVLLASHQ